MKHTPGPWRPNEKYDHFWVSAGKGKKRVEIATACTDDVGHETAAVNAMLIAAAPDLLKACKEVVDDPMISDYKNEMLRAAIAKAEGGA
jgi:hypothetical protein